MYLSKEKRSFKVALSIVLLSISLVSCTNKEEKVKDFISKGNALMEKGDAIHAILEYKNALQLDPQNAKVTFLLAKAYLANKEYRKAYGALQNTVTKDPGFDRARMEMASLLISARQGEKALEHLNKIKKKDGLEPRLSLLRARALMLQGKYNEAINILEGIKSDNKQVPMLLTICFKQTGDISKMREALKKWQGLDSSDPDPYLFMAQYLAENGKKTEAARELQKMVEAQPSNSRLRLLQARLLERLGLVDEALKAYKKLPQTPEIMRAKADFHLRHGHSDRAIKILEGLYRQNPQDVGTALKLSEVLALSKKFEEAQKILNGIREEQLGQPEREKVMLAKASIKASQGKMDDAKRICEELLNRNQGSVGAHILLGKILLNERKLDKAEVHLHQAATLDPRNTDAQILLARCQMLNKKRAMAGDTLKNALKRNPSDKRLRMALVKYHLLTKNYSLALDVLEQGLELSPKEILYLKSAGEIELLRKRYKKAEEYFQRICKLKPDIPLGYMEMGRLMLVQNKRESALKWFEKAYQTTGGWRVALPALIQTYIKFNDLDGALEIARKEAEKRPDSAMAQYHLGKVLELKGEGDKAERAFSRAIELAPKWPAPYQALAALYLKQNRIKEAISKMERLYKDSPSWSQGMNLAILYQYDGNYDKAIEIYKSLIKTHGKSPLLYNNLAYLMAENSKGPNDLEKAKEMITEVISKHPKNANFLDTAGWVEYKAGDPDTAWQYLQDALSEAPDQGVILLHCAAVAHELGKIHQAKEYLVKAMKQKLDPQARALAQALKEKWH